MTVTTTTEPGAPARGARRQARRRPPEPPAEAAGAALRVDPPDGCGPHGDPRLPRGAPDRAVGAGIRHVAGVRRPRAVGGVRQLPPAVRRPVLLEGPAAHARVLLRERGAHDVDRRRRRPAAEQPRVEDAPAGLDVVDPRLGDARPHRDCGVAVDLRLRVRPRQLGLRPSGRVVARRPDELLRRGDDHRRLDGHPVRGLHRLRRPLAGSRRPARGRQPRRRRRGGAVPLHHRPVDQADPDDPHRAVDAVGLPGVHPDLRAPAGRWHLT